ncbi:MAG: FkbM family methyltransferase [Longimicrobiaceae bacterium]
METAEGAPYRRRSAAERIVGAAARLLPEGAARRWLRAVWRATLGRRGVVSRLPGGEAVRLLAAYRFVTWNPAEYRAFRAAVRPGAVALDVGANVGAYTLLLGRWVGPEGRVYAFEPSPETFQGLTRHLALNGLGGTVVPVAAAVSRAAGRGTLSGGGVSGGNRLDAAGSGPAVEMVSLDGFCEREGIVPSFIKIDVEGAELDVLCGARETIRRAGPKLALFVEMHPTIWREMGITAADLQAELELQGLRAEPLRPGVADPWRLEGECLRLVPR